MVSTSSTVTPPAISIGPSLFNFPIAYMYMANNPVSWLSTDSSMYFHQPINASSTNSSLLEADASYSNNKSGGIGWYAI